MSSTQTINDQTTETTETTIEVVTSAGKDNREITTETPTPNETPREVTIEGEIIEIYGKGDQESLIIEVTDEYESTTKELFIYAAVKTDCGIYDIRFETNLVEEILNMQKEEAIQLIEDKKLKGELISNEQNPLFKQAKAELVDSQIKVITKPFIHPIDNLTVYVGKSIVSL